MESERWREIEEIYYRAVACPVARRPALLDEACGEDRGLRTEVESLLQAEEQADSFLSPEELHDQIADLAVAPVIPVVGRTLGRYQILESIGAGAMGEVYLALDTALDRRVALKLLPAEFTADPARIAMFVREAKAASALNHPNIITIHEIGESGDTWFIATEFIEGATLRQRLAAGSLALDDALDIALQCAAALETAHRAGILHRDIKPENIMLRPDGVVKVVDFGLARVMDDDRPGATQHGHVKGTPRYMSPEQARGAELDARSDVFSLGAVMYEMLAGRPAIEGATTADVFAALLSAESPRPLDSGIRGGADLEPIVARALHKDRERRVQTMQELAGELKAVRQRLEWRRAGTSDVAAGPIRAARQRRWWAVAAVGMAAALLLLFDAGGLRERIRSALFPHRIASLAVLPLVNNTNDPELEYMVDGLTDQLISDLARTTSLRVIGRTSMMRYKGVSTPRAEIARALNVDAIVEGSISRAGGLVRIDTQLLDARRDRQLWTHTYERGANELLAIASEVARDVNREIAGAAAHRDTTARTEAVNPEAYDLYLRGRFAWNKRTADGYRTALEYFNQSIEKEPTYAPAHAGLADTYLLLGEYLVWPQADAFPKARAAAARALELDPTLGEAHTSLGQVNADEWKWADADREFQRAIDLKGGYATARQWRAEYLIVTGRTDEAVAEIKRALALDPLSVIINTQVGWMLTIARQYDEAIEQLRRTIDMAPRFPQAYTNLGIAYDQKGQHAEAIAAFQQAIEHDGGLNAEVWLARAQALGGQTARARESLDRLMPFALKGQVAPTTVALAYLALGDQETAFSWMQKGCAQRALGPVTVYPPFDPLRSDPRFAELVRCMGLSSGAR